MSTEQYRLSQSAIDYYRKTGYLIPDYRLPDDLLKRIADEYEAMLQQHPQLDPNFIPSPHVPDFTPGVIHSQPWLGFACIPEILDIIGQLIGPDFLMWGSAIFGKPAHVGKATPMHQDGEYWPIKPLASITLWIAIDAATPENGCLRLVPGSHQARKLYSHRRDDNPDFTLNQVLSESDTETGEAIDIVLEPGQISLHDIYMIHGSRANTSGARRAGLTYRYMPTSSHFDHQLALHMTRTMGTTDMSQRALYLLRGRDLCGKNNLTVGHNPGLCAPDQNAL